MKMCKQNITECYFDQHRSGQVDKKNLYLKTISFFALRTVLTIIAKTSHIWHICFCPTLKPTKQNQKSQILQPAISVTFMLTLLFHVDCFGQLQTPTVPSMAHRQQQQRQQIDQQNRQLMQQFGHTPPPTQADILAQQQRWLNGKPPELTPQEKRMTELKGILNEVHAINTNMKKSGYYNQPAFIEDSKKYKQTLADFKQMVENPNSASIADAIYKSEAAFGKLQLTYSEYKKIIAQSAAFIKEWMAEHSLDLNNQEAVHYAIQQFMGDSLRINSNNLPGVGIIPKSHKPFMYDYIDYRGSKDINNYFLTKTLATGTGQCNTLPRVYLVLAEAMNVESYLTFAPQHSFIKYKNNQGIFQNYEPTIHRHMTDQDYMEEMPIMSTATQNGLYLQPLNKQQIIASLMIDLAYNFMREHWVYDGTFMNECIDNGMRYFTNSEGLLLKNMLLASQLERVLAEAKITDLNEIEKHPKAHQVFKAYRENEMQIEALGIQNYPESKYQAMLAKHDRRGKLQAAKGINTKSKRSLFYN
jgi:hypothetical protein